MPIDTDLLLNYLREKSLESRFEGEPWEYRHALDDVKKAVLSGRLNVGRGAWSRSVPLYDENGNLRELWEVWEDMAYCGSRITGSPPHCEVEDPSPVTEFARLEKEVEGTIIMIAAFALSLVLIVGWFR